MFGFYVFACLHLCFLCGCVLALLCVGVFVVFGVCAFVFLCVCVFCLRFSVFVFVLFV